MSTMFLNVVVFFYFVVVAVGFGVAAMFSLSKMLELPGFEPGTF